LTEAAGATAVAFQTAEAERIVRECPPAPPGPQQLVFSVDGAMVPLLHGVWAEARTLAVGSVTVTSHPDRPALSTTSELSYFSRLTSSERFGTQATAELHRRGLERAEQVGAVVDGAEWCQSFIDLHAPHAVRVLDCPHAASYVTAIGQTIVDGQAVLTEGAIAQLRHDLKHDGPTQVLRTLRTVVQAHPSATELPKQLAYLEKRVEQMRYPTFQAAGWPIGSGMVESANKLVVEERLKGPGMHWAERNVDPILALRNALCSDRWVEVWMQIERDQRSQLQARRLERQRQRRDTGRVDAANRAVGWSNSVGAPATQPAAERGAAASTATATTGPTTIHPWRRPWSIRRQRELASTA
jgi:hypothetical protein